MRGGARAARRGRPGHPTPDIMDNPETGGTPMAKAGQGQVWTAATRGLARGLGAALVFGFALNLLMLAVPLYSMQLFDRVLGSGHVETLVLLTLVTALALAAMGGF